MVWGGQGGLLGQHTLVQVTEAGGRPHCWHSVPSAPLACRQLPPACGVQTTAASVHASAPRARSSGVLPGGSLEGTLHLRHARRHHAPLPPLVPCGAIAWRETQAEGRKSMACTARCGAAKGSGKGHGGVCTNCHGQAAAIVKMVPRREGGAKGGMRRRALGSRRAGRRLARAMQRAGCRSIHWRVARGEETRGSGKGWY